MRSTTKNLALAAVASMALFTAACGSDDTSGDDTASEETSAAPAEDDPAADLVGSGCADYASQFPDGPGSVSGMAQDPVATAASNNKLLTQLTAAVSGQLNPDVNLVDTLNGDEFTVFAPTDEAFKKLPADVVETLGTPEGAETLQTVLTYHVIPGQLSPDEVAGMQTSVQGEDVDVTGEGENLKFNDANLVCGGVKTANATVYMIDTVMMPPSAS